MRQYLHQNENRRFMSGADPEEGSGVCVEGGGGGGGGQSTPPHPRPQFLTPVKLLEHPSRI